jgi:hypothetical protein
VLRVEEVEPLVDPKLFDYLVMVMVVQIGEVMSIGMRGAGSDNERIWAMALFQETPSGSHFRRCSEEDVSVGRLYSSAHVLALLMSLSSLRHPIQVAALHQRTTVLGECRGQRSNHDTSYQGCTLEPGRSSELDRG